MKQCKFYFIPSSFDNPLIVIPFQERNVNEVKPDGRCPFGVIAMRSNRKTAQNPTNSHEIFDMREVNGTTTNLRSFSLATTPFRMLIRYESNNPLSAQLQKLIIFQCICLGESGTCRKKYCLFYISLLLKCNPIS